MHQVPLFLSKPFIYIYKHNYKNNAYILMSLYSSFSSIYIIPYLVFTTLYPCILSIPLFFPLYIYVSSMYTSVSPIYPVSLYTLYPYISLYTLYPPVAVSPICPNILVSLYTLCLLYPLVAVPLYAPISP